MAAPGVASARLAVARAPGAQTLTVVVPLVADDSGLARFAAAVSTPGSPLYGHYASIPELARRFGARSSSAAAVMRFLRAHGAARVALNPTRMYVQATMSVAGAQRAFGTSLALLHSSDGRRFLAPVARAAGGPGSVALPASLRGLATGVIGLDTESLATPHRLAASGPTSAYFPRSGTPTGCAGALSSGGFTPGQYLTAYNYDPLQQSGLRGAGERVALIEIDGFNYSDITTFDSCFGLPRPPIQTYTVGFRHPLPAGGESTLDLELLTAAAPRLVSLDVYENRGDASQVLQAFTAPLTAPGAKPQILSASLGICEQFMWLAMGNAGINAIERDIQLATATGITVLASAGDDGSSSCQHSDGSIDPRLDVSYPASSVYATGVGGTNLTLDASNHIVGEQVWNDGGLHPSAGGGGESGLFHRPSYQRGLVADNARAVPDVALLADLAPGYAIYCTAGGSDGCTGWMSVGGTSAAAPLLAGGLALVDQDLRLHHRRALGLLNPLLYHLAAGAGGPSIFRDTTAGNNDLGPFIQGFNTPLGCCTAAAGYDEASGLGSLNLAAFDQAALLALPPAPDLALTLPHGQRPLRARQLQARLRCSTACRAYVSGDVILSATRSFSVHSPTRRFSRAGSQLLRLPLTARQVALIRSALAAHQQVFTELYGVALDANGQPLTVTSGAVMNL